MCKRFLLKSNDHDHPKTRTEEPIEVDHIRPEKMFLILHSVHLAKCCKSRSVNVIPEVKELVMDEVCRWRCGEAGYLKRNSQRTVDISISNTLKTRLATRVYKTRTRETSTLKPCRCQWGE